ncbi:MAG: LicD family protein [Clostridia bacterium]|nr:LicD family protein [Clostridia bacterium]
MKDITDLQTIKNTTTQILIDIDQFCSENNITYFLAYGTLLGAIRHDGFIPWDDDLDIMMPRQDYDRFIKEYKSNRFKLAKPRDPGYYFTFAKVHDDSTVVIENTSYNEHVYGMYVDIFPFDAVPNDEKKAKILDKRTYFYLRLLRIKARKVSEKSSLLNKLFLKPTQFILGMFSFDYLINTIDSLAKSYNYEECERVASFEWNDKRNTFYDKKWFEGTLKHIFENKEFNIPKGYKEWLTQAYGDYMTLPPPEQRVLTHGFKVYLKEEDKNV